MILETLGELQFSKPDAVEPLVRLVHQTQAMVPQLRAILAGSGSYPSQTIDLWYI